MKIKKPCIYPNTLKGERTKKNLKQKEVAALLGFKCEDRISHWEKGQSIPSIPNLFKLCRFYNIQPFDLYPEL